MFITNLNELIGSGWQADVYRLGDKAVKVFKEHCSKRGVFCEAAIHAMVENTKLPIPKIYEVIECDKKMAIVMDLVEGPLMADVILNDMANMQFNLEPVIDLQIRIHGIHAAGFPSQKERLTQRITNSMLLNGQQQAKLLGLLNTYEMGDCLCHGDYHFRNLIKTDNGIVIIDWVDATAGNPEADLCRTYMLYALHAPKGLAGMYLDAYCQKSNKSAYDILKWLPIIAGARLSEKNEFEKDKLLTWVEMDGNEFIVAY